MDAMDAMESVLLGTSELMANNWTSESATSPVAEDIRLPYTLRIIATVTVSFLLIIGALGNSLVPLVVLRTKDLRNSTNLFLINLSIADLLVLVTCAPTVLVELHSRPEVWDLGEFMCKYPRLLEMSYIVHVD